MPSVPTSSLFGFMETLLSLCPGAGFGGGGAEPGDHVPCARDYAVYRGTPVFLAGGEPDVPPVGG